MRRDRTAAAVCDLVAEPSEFQRCNRGSTKRALAHYRFHRSRTWCRHSFAPIAAGLRIGGVSLRLDRKMFDHQATLLSSAVVATLIGW